MITTGLSRNIQGRRHSDCKNLWGMVEPLMDAALASPPAQRSWWLAQALYECAVFWTNHRPVHARLRADQALSLARVSGDVLSECLVLARIAWLCSEEETLPEFEQVSAELTARISAKWSAYLQSDLHQHDWLHAYLAGDYSTAIAELRQQVARHAACGYTDTSPEANMVMVFTEAGLLDEAIQQSCALLQRYVGKRHQGPSRGLLNNLAVAHLAQSDVERARAVQLAWWPLANSHDYLRHWSCNAALLAALEQRPRSALVLLGYSDAACERAAPGLPRQAAEQRMVGRTLTLVQSALGGLSFEAHESCLRAYGAALSASALLDLAMAADDQGFDT